MSKARNLIETIAGLVPGYRGYSDREARRDTDRALRRSIATTLERPRTAVDEAIADCSQRMDFSRIESLERMRRRLIAVTDAIRHAPAGYAGLLDTDAVDADAIDRLHTYDLALSEHAEKVATAVRSAASGTEDAGADALLEELHEDVRKRDEILQGAN